MARQRPTPINRLPFRIHYAADVSAYDVDTAKEAVRDLVGIASVTLNVTTMGGPYIARLETIGHGHGRQVRGHQQLALENPRQAHDGMYATFMLDLLTARRNDPHFGLALFAKDVYAPNTNWVIGVSGENMGTVMSTWRFQQANRSARKEVLKTGFMHEFGHIFKLAESGPRVEQSLGSHCTNLCIMRQGLSMTDWEGMTADRLNHEALCDECKTDLVKYFWTLGGP